MEQRISLKKGLRVLTLFALLTSSMVGMAWATLFATLWDLAGPSLLLSLILGATFCIIIGLGYAELCSALPYASGEYIYTYHALGKFWSFVTGWFLLLGYGTMVPAQVIIFSQVLNTLLPILPIALNGVIMSVVFGLINFFGIKLSGKVQVFLACFLFIGVAIFIFGGLSSVRMENFSPFFSKGAVGTLTVVPLMLLAFTGFDIVPQVVEEVNAPIKKVVLLIPVSIAFVAVFYLGAALVSGGIAPEVLLSSHLAVPVIDVATIFLGRNGALLILVTGALGLITTLNAFLIAASRLIYGMAREGALPGVLSALHPRFGTPYPALIIITILNILGAFYQELLLVFQISSAAFMVTFCLTSISVIVLRYRKPELDRPYRVPLYPLFPLIGIFVSTIALLIVLTTIESHGFFLLTLWLIGGLAYYWWFLRSKATVSLHLKE